MNRHFLTLLIILVTAVAARAGGGRNFVSRSVTTDDGLPGNSVNCIVQDSDGYIWIGTKNGLCRYDGYSAVCFPHLGASPDEPADMQINSIKRSCNGRRLLITTATGFESAYDLATARFSGYAPASTQKQEPKTFRGRKAVAIGQNSGSTYLLGTDNRVYVYSANGKLLSATSLPPQTGKTIKAETSFFCNGQWIIYTRDNVMAVDLSTGKAVTPLAPVIPGAVGQGSVKGFNFVSDGAGDLWIFPEHGRPRHFHLIDNARYTFLIRRKFNVAQTPSGLIFIATFGNGLFVFNPADGTMSHHTSEDDAPLIHSNYLKCIAVDRAGSVWVGSEEAGVSCITEIRDIWADYIYPEPGRRGDWSNNVRSLAAESRGGILISTAENKIYSYSPETGHTGLLMETPGRAYSFLSDSKGRKWIGLRGGGIMVDGQRFSRGDKQHHIPSDMIYDLYEDSRGRVWAATMGAGLLCLQVSGHGQMTYTRFLTRNSNERRVRVLETDNSGTMWIATDNGIYSVDTRQNMISDSSFRCHNKRNSSVPGNEVVCLHRSRGGMLWAGIVGCGLVRCTIEGLRITATNSTGIREGLANSNVVSIAEDRFGSIWAATEKGLSRVNPTSGAVRSYRLSPYLMGNIFTENCALPRADGSIMFGTRCGVLVLRPEKPVHDTATSLCRITDIGVNGLSAFASGDTALTSRLGDNGGTVRLPHNRNSVSFFFSAFDYSRGGSVLYRFRLDGHDSGWRDATSVNRTGYSNLPPGRYTFRVSALGTDNRWGRETALNVVVERPWYASWWAWAVYLLSGDLLGCVLYSAWRRNFELRRQMWVDRQVSEFRLGFFTNVAHEFRTPLAIIQGAAARMQRSQPAAGQKPALLAVNRGVRRLSRLIDRIMQFRRLSTGNMKLNVARGDIGVFVEAIFRDFRDVAALKEISMEYECGGDTAQVLFDRTAVETAIYNLLSNAIKYTPAKGHVLLTLKTGTENVTATVEDSGPGISEEQLARLFSPFMGGQVSQGGMGIGLYLARRMAEAHHGTLLYSRSGKLGGARFTLTIPAGDGAYGPDDYTNAAETVPPGHSLADEDSVLETVRQQAVNDYTVAIIEDDPDMMRQLRQDIGEYFNVAGYMDGRSGVEGVLGQRPSLLVCDVMLPDTDGYDVVRRLRHEPATETMPVIMLTALADDNHQLRGYMAGADDYMTKPCDFRLLLLRIIQLIEWSHRVAPPASAKAGGLAAKAGAQPRTVTASREDKEFPERVRQIVNDHISEHDLTAERLASMLCMGRTKFFGKMNELVGATPNRFVNDMRMEKAATMLREGDRSLTEISTAVGIEDVHYFIKSFKAKYGVTPGKYRGN